MKIYKEALKYVFLLVLFCIVQYAFSQKSILTQHQSWSQYFISVRVHKNWSVNADALYRWKELSADKLQAGLRVSVARHFKQPFTISGGYVYFLHFLPEKGGITRVEHRPWQQLLVNSKLGRILVQHRYRLEQRFMEHVNGLKPPGAFDFNFRMRYQLNLQTPINKKEISKGALYAIAYNEIFVNFGKEIVYNFYDQNRSYIGLGYQLTKSFATTLGYQYIWQQRSKGNQFYSFNCLRLTFIHNLDCRKTEQ